MKTNKTKKIQMLANTVYTINLQVVRRKGVSDAALKKECEELARQLSAKGDDKNFVGVDAICKNASIFVTYTNGKKDACNEY